MWVLNVQEVFRIDSARIVLVGVVEPDTARIESGPAEVWAAGQLAGRIQIEGEMVPRVLGARGPLRAVSTLSTLPVAQDLLVGTEIRGGVTASGAR